MCRRPTARRPFRQHLADRQQRRFARRLAAGAGPVTAAKAEGLDEAQAKDLLGEAGFQELVAVFREHFCQSPEERLRRLAERALFVIEDEIDELRRPTVAAWLLYEIDRGRNPAVELARSVVRTCERAGRPATAVTEPATAPASRPASAAAAGLAPVTPLSKLVPRQMSAVRARLARIVLAESGHLAAAVGRAATIAPAATAAQVAAAEDAPAGRAAEAGQAPVAAKPQPRRPAARASVSRRLPHSPTGARNLGRPILRSAFPCGP